MDLIFVSIFKTLSSIYSDLILNLKSFFSLAIAVAQCLLVISEDNPSCWAILTNYGVEFETILDAINPEDNKNAMLCSVTAGIMSNVPAFSVLYLNKILSVLSTTLSINHRQSLGQLTSILPIEGVDREGFDVDNQDIEITEEETEQAATSRRRKNDLPTTIDREVKLAEWILEAQRISAETLTNLCSTEDENLMNDDEDEMSDAESVHDYDKSTHSSSSNIQNIDKIPVEIQEAIKSFGLVEKLWQRAQPIAENVFDVLKETKPSVIKRLNKLRISSILCLQNLCNCLTMEDLGGSQAIYGVWLDLGQQAFQGSQEIELLDATTSLMRAALDHLRSNPELFSQMTNSDLELIVNGVKNCSHSEVQANWLRMLGILGCFLPEPLVKIIMEFIIETCLKYETDVWTMSEGLDALMDIFSDKDWHQISYDLNLVQKSRELEKILRNKLKQQKRELGDRYQAVSTVRTNLKRFSTYIESQLKQFVSNNVK